MKTLKKPAILLLTLSILLSSVACGKKLDDSYSSDSGDEYYSDLSSTDGNGNQLNGSSNETIEHIEGSGIASKNDFTRYTIIATKSNARALDVANGLSVKLADKGFSLEVNKRSVYEIIIGNNTASETREAIDQLSKSDKDYLIKFSGTKIVIVAKNDLVLPEACDMFYETYIKNIKNKTLEVKDGTATLGISKNLTTLAYDGVLQYEIVLGNVSSEVKTRAAELASFIKTMCGVTSVNSSAKYDKSKKQR